MSLRFEEIQLLVSTLLLLPAVLALIIGSLVNRALRPIIRSIPLAPLEGDIRDEGDGR